MIICPRCGTQNSPETAACLVCGNAFEPRPPPPPVAQLGNTVPLTPPAAAPREAGAALGQTLPLEQSQAKQPERGPGQTLMLPDRPQREPSQSDSSGRLDAAAPSPPPQSNLGSTVFGIGFPFERPVLQAQVPALDTSEVQPDGATPHATVPLARTMLGIAPLQTPEIDSPASSPHAPMPLARTMLGIAPLQTRETDQSADAYSTTLGAAAPLSHGTIQGVARPGIAPLNPGVPKPETPSPETLPSPLPPPPAGQGAETGLGEPGARTLTLRAAKKSSRVASAAIAAAVGLLGAGVGALIFFSGPGRIDARVVLDTEGRERLDLSCKRCKDGTHVELAASVGTFQGGRASIRVPGTLRVGDNALALSIRAPDSTRQDEISLNVRIDYRVRTDLGPLSEPVPRLRVIVDALPGSTVSIDDRPIALSKSSRASLDFDMTGQLTGLDPKVRRLERRIRYAVVPPGASNQSGQVVVQLGIAPLMIDAPGESITLEGANFMIAGRTAKGGGVSVEARPLLVDSEGRFAQLMNVSAVGETTIRARASAPNHAPRLFPIRVRRVASLIHEAARIRLQATTSYAPLAEDTNAKRGWKVALEGSVLEHKGLQYSTVFLFEASSGCRSPPCLSRVAYGAPSELSSGDRVSVFGQVAGAVEGPRRGTQIPEILADFVLKKGR